MIARPFGGVMWGKRRYPQTNPQAVPTPVYERAMPAIRPLPTHAAVGAGFKPAQQRLLRPDEMLVVMAEQP